MKISMILKDENENNGPMIVRDFDDDTNDYEEKDMFLWYDRWEEKSYVNSDWIGGKRLLKYGCEV